MVVSVTPGVIVRMTLVALEMPLPSPALWLNLRPQASRG
jgi:hypothetical protein